MNKYERLPIALPKGELEKDVCSFMKGIGIQVDPPSKNDKRLLRPSNNFPIDVFWIRASEVGRRVQSPAVPVVGLTGSDCALEDNVIPTDIIPIAEFVPKPVQSRLYLGVTRTYLDFMEREGLGIEALQGTRVATKFVNLASEYFLTNGVDVTLEYTAGADEIMPAMYPDCYSVFGVISSGATTRANGIVPYDDPIHQVYTCLVTNPTQMTQGQELILDDFRDKISVAQEQRRML